MPLIIPAMIKRVFRREFPLAFFKERSQRNRLPPLHTDRRIFRQIQVDAQMRRAIRQLVGRNRAGRPAQKGIAVGEPLLAAVGVNVFQRTLDGLLQFLHFQRLEQIILHTQRNGLAGVFELVIRAQHDAVRIRAELTDMADQRKPVHCRHADIRHDERNRLLLGQHERLFAVSGCQHRPDAKLLPGDAALQRFQHARFIVRKQYGKHGLRLLFLRFISLSVSIFFKMSTTRGAFLQGYSNF